MSHSVIIQRKEFTVEQVQEILESSDLENRFFSFLFFSFFLLFFFVRERVRERDKN